MAVDLNGNVVVSSGVTYSSIWTKKITRDGLTVYLDSNNINSYPGSGTVWYDLSGYGNNGTLYNMNSPSGGNTSGFDTTTGYMMFDRHLGAGDVTVNNYVLIPNSNSLDDCLPQNGFTMEIWFKETSTACTAFTKWNGSWEFYYCSGALVYRTQGTGGADNSIAGYSTSPGNWRQLVGTHDGTLETFFINGTRVYNSINIVTAQDTTSDVSIGAYYNGIYASYGAIPIFRLYNRPLNAYEVAENFQAERQRFNI